MLSMQAIVIVTIDRWIVYSIYCGKNGDKERLSRFECVTERIGIFQQWVITDWVAAQTIWLFDSARWSRGLTMEFMIRNQPHHSVKVLSSRTFYTTSLLAFARTSFSIRHSIPCNRLAIRIIAWPDLESHKSCHWNSPTEFSVAVRFFVFARSVLAAFFAVPFARIFHLRCRHQHQTYCLPCVLFF